MANLCRDLLLPPGETSVIVPHEHWIAILIEEHNEAEANRIDFEAIAYGDEWAAYQEPEPFRYVYSIVNV